MGEIGLDYSSNSVVPAEVQKRALPRLLELGRRRRLPVVIHCRGRDKLDLEAGRDCLKILKEELRSDHTIHRHCFNGSLGEFRDWRDSFRNCYFGITGLATSAGCHPQLALVISTIPEDRLLLETDAPYLVPNGGGTNINTPYLLPLIAGYVAEMRGVTTDHILRITARNAEACYRLPPS